MTEVSLREYVEALMEKQNKAVDAALVAADKAVTAALAAADKATEKASADNQRWRENSNEWRDSMNDREAKFVGVDMYNEATKGIRGEIATIREDMKGIAISITQIQSEKKGAVDMRTFLFSLIFVVVALAGLWIKVG